ncbi:ABC transporter substrate-binding protein [Arsenicicoccus sp. oral taxon 190]|uniref:ABC transporter substrate-binding protein n=1 Tax=Arsenicicoccus sp. oral taxon 190 TaxID=1658671 RepID=UPI00067A419D|nr:ABC transporter substrate-binding protein [Arsenicicoccus sp. oral taxon 190]AKT51616.1 peptide ABC transporter substrate-binding protein [Arsenicicoccus sp. oral taxon 190]
MPTAIRRAAVALATAALLASSACSAGSSTQGSGSGQSGSDGGQGQGKDTAAIGLVLEPTSLDFTKADGAAIPQALLGNVYEGLVRVDDAGKIQPALATAWQVSPDRKTYTFDLVEGAKFSNGAPFTADDAVFSIERVTKDWAVSVKKSMDVVAKATALSPTRLQVTLSRPSNSWLYAMTTRVGAMFSRTGVADLATTPVGTGPYTLGEWKRGDSITLRRNDSYHGTKPFFRQVTLRYIKDPAALNNALLSGTIDVIGTVQSPESLQQFTSNPKYHVIEGTTNGEVMLTMNNATPLLKDKAVRQAIRQAIDHKALLQTCWAGHGTLLGTMVPPTDPWYEDLTGLLPFNRAKATQALKDAGAAGKEIRLRLPSAPYATTCGQVVKSDLEQAGLKVKVDQIDFPTWLTDVFKGGSYDLTIVAHVEPRDIGRMFGNPAYYPHYDNKAVQAELAAADAGTEQEQVEHMKKAARLVAEDSASDVLFLMPNLVVADKGIQGLPTNAVGETLDLARLSRS